MIFKIMNNSKLYVCSCLYKTKQILFFQKIIFYLVIILHGRNYTLPQFYMAAILHCRNSTWPQLCGRNSILPQISMAATLWPQLSISAIVYGRNCTWPQFYGRNPTAAILRGRNSTVTVEAVI